MRVLPFWKIWAVALLALSVYVAPASASFREDVRELREDVVDEKLGKKAGGRRIIKDGVRDGGEARPATHREVVRYRDGLRRILRAAERPRVAVRAPAPAVVPRASQAAPTRPQAPSAPSGSTGRSAGGYCGAYQFDDQTWRSVGGSGSACGASRAEQDRRAQRLYEQRGAQPWPTCGRFLPDWDALRQCENGGRY